MSNETKRDVLEKLAECYAEVSDAYTNETGSPYYCDDEPNYLKDYDNSLPDETDKQKNCPYCHNKCGLKISQDAYSFWYRNKRFKPLFCSNCGRKL